MHRVFGVVTLLLVFHLSPCSGMKKFVGKKGKRGKSVRFKKIYYKAYTNCGFEKCVAKDCLKKLNNAWQEFLRHPVTREGSWEVFVSAIPAWVVGRNYKTKFLRQLKRWYFDNIENAFQYLVDYDSIEFKSRILQLVINHLQNNKQFYMNHLCPKNGKKKKHDKYLKCFIASELERLSIGESFQDSRDNSVCEKVQWSQPHNSPGTKYGYYWTAEDAGDKQDAQEVWEL